MIAGLPGFGLSTLFYVTLLLGMGVRALWRQVQSLVARLRQLGGEYHTAPVNSAGGADRGRSRATPAV